MAVALNAEVEACFLGDRMWAATSAETAALILGVAGGPVGLAATGAVRAAMVVGACDRGLVCSCGSRVCGVGVMNVDRVLSIGVVTAEEGALKVGFLTEIKPRFRSVEQAVRGAVRWIDSIGER